MSARSRLAAVTFLMCSCLMCSTVVASPLPCVTGTLAGYIALGSTGCTVGPALIFNNFSFAVLSSSGGAVALTPPAIAVDPQIGPGAEYGLNYASSGFSVSAGQSIQYLLSYTIDPPPIIRGFKLNLFTDPPVFPGFAEISSTECLGAAFSGSSCSGVPLVQDVFSNGVVSSLQSVQAFSPVGILGDRTTITLNAASGGSSSFTSFTESTISPEPRSALLLAAALAALLIGAGLRRFTVRYWCSGRTEA
ncbi:MAG TPA: hypothetical protein VHU83_09770 [Bryobacteraceae bacterium]|nr:hypothetical protein [Bryobacteraceae bacterium]